MTKEQFYAKLSNKKLREVKNTLVESIKNPYSISTRRDACEELELLIKEMENRGLDTKNLKELFEKQY
jgi:hypothetical protein